MSEAHATIQSPDDYGFGTWRTALTHNGTEYPVVYASGNGGQFVIAIPSVQIVVVLISAGNYMGFPT